MATRELLALNESTPQIEAPQAGDTVVCPITLQAATGNEIAYDLQYTTNKATSGNDTGLLVNLTDTASPGTSLLMDLQTGGTSNFQLRPGGEIRTGSLSSPDSGYFDVYTSNVAAIAANTAGIKFRVQAASTPVVKLTSDNSIGWTSATNNCTGTPDLLITRDAAGSLAQRNGANAQTFNIYGDYASATDYQRSGIVTSRTATTVPSAASFTLSGFIPDGAFLIGITTRVDTTCTTATGYTVGDGSDVDLWGVSAAVAEGTATGSADFTAAGASGTLYTSAQDVVVTSSGGNFDGTGVITVCAHYMITEAD